MFDKLPKTRYSKLNLIDLGKPLGYSRGLLKHFKENLSLYKKGKIEEGGIGKNTSPPQKTTEKIIVRLPNKHHP